MARTPSVLYQGHLSTAAAALYTLSTGEVTVTSIEAANTSTGTIYFTLYRIPNGQSAADSRVIGQKMNQLVGTDDPDGGGYWIREVPIPLTSTGDNISGIAEYSSAIAVMITGYITT